MEKFPIGPHKPNPGPTFPIHVITELIVVSKSKLFNETKNNKIPTIMIKLQKKLKSGLRFLYLQPYRPL